MSAKKSKTAKAKTTKAKSTYNSKSNTRVTKEGNLTIVATDPARCITIDNKTECPGGGDHDWAKDDDDQTSCAKCHEPKTASKAKKAKGVKATKATVKAEPANDAKPKKLSAIDAAEQVLSKSDKPLNCKELIETMAAKKLWSSPGGKTPAATP